MSERALTKTAPTHYVVFFPCDKSWFMATNNKVMCSSLVTPIVGERYAVKWGSRGESDEGVIVGAGDRLEMRTMLRTKKGTVLEDDAVVSVSEPNNTEDDNAAPSTTVTAPKPAPKCKVTTQAGPSKLKKNGRPCTVIAVATPPGYYEIPEPTAVAPEPTAVAPEPTAVAQEPTAVAPEPTSVAPEPTAVAPEPTFIAPEPTFIAPEPTYVAPEPTPIRHDGAIITYLQHISTGIQQIQATQRSFNKRLTDLVIQSQNCVQRLDQILHNTNTNTTNITSSSDITRRPTTRRNNRGQVGEPSLRPSDYPDLMSLMYTTYASTPFTESLNDYINL